MMRFCKPSLSMFWSRTEEEERSVVVKLTLPLIYKIHQVCFIVGVVDSHVVRALEEGMSSGDGRLGSNIDPCESFVTQGFSTHEQLVKLE